MSGSMSPSRFNTPQDSAPGAGSPMLASMASRFPRAVVAMPHTAHPEGAARRIARIGVAVVKCLLAERQDFLLSTWPRMNQGVPGSPRVAASTGVAVIDALNHLVAAADGLRATKLGFGECTRMYSSLDARVFRAVAIGAQKHGCTPSLRHGRKPPVHRWFSGSLRVKAEPGWWPQLVYEHDAGALRPDQHVSPVWTWRGSLDLG